MGRHSRNPGESAERVAPLCTVSSVSWEGHVKRLILQPDRQPLTVPLSACVSKGDSIRVFNGDAWVVCKNGEAQILRPYVVEDTMRLGGIRLAILIKEITEPEEYHAYKALADFHYRGHLIHGRTARLIVRTFHPTYPKVIGYIELATPFYMNKARANIFNAPFRMKDISWDAWDMPTMRRYIHLVVRIARCVVYPEFRGLGLGQILIKHAAKFARTRWQVAGLMPYFLEISADMLKYVPFAEKAGMMFIGETEGNLSRVHKDMEYLIRNVHRVKGGEIVSEDSSGIVDQQVARMDRAIELMQREGLTRQELIQRLQKLSQKTVLRDFALFHGIVSLPKPTYLTGLNRQATLFLRRRVAEVAPQNGRKPPQICLEPLAEPIRLCNMTVTFFSRVRRTRRTHAVQQAFDISPDHLQFTTIQELSLDIQPREIVLIVGPSGAGKTTLLDLLRQRRKERRGIEIRGELHLPGHYLAGTFEGIPSKSPLIEVIGEEDVQSALYLLGLAGLSEPSLYLKRFDQLSKGQQYRAMLARLITMRANVWLADEFCANLDSVTANVVAYNVQRTARKLGITVIAAAPHCDAFLSSLRPDKVLSLTNAWEYRVLNGKEYMKAVSQSRTWDSSPPRLRLLPEFFEAIRSGKKHATIRLGRKWLQPGLLLLESNSESLAVNVTEVIHKKFSDLTENDAYDDGFDCLSLLTETLHSMYPNAHNDSYMTIIRFGALCGL